MVPFPGVEEIRSSPPIKANRSLMEIRPRVLVLGEGLRTSSTLNPIPLSLITACMVLSDEVSLSLASVAWLCLRILFRPSWKSLYMVMFVMDGRVP
jgi:hypothetical protein